MPMMRAIYRPGGSALHQMPAGIKLLILALLAIWMSSGAWREAVIGGGIVGLGWMLARLSTADARAALRGLVLFAAVIFVAQAFLSSTAAAVLIVAKLLILVL